MKWISSLDELLYEVMSWLLFWPLTLWRTMIRPLDMMDYADRQLDLPEGEQYAAALSPPLFLALSLLVAHGASVALGQPDAIVTNRNGLAGLITDDSSALIFRLILFASFPLFAAARYVRRSGVPLARPSLRAPFYAACYPAAVFALGLSVATDLTLLPHPSARTGSALLVVATILYYGVTQTRWFARKLGIGHASAAGAVLLSLLEGLTLLLFMGVLFTR